MDIPRFYKASALPASPTAADDGVWFVRPNPSVGYVCYIITNGVAVQQDAVTTAALTTALSAMDFDSVLNNGNTTTYQPIFNRGTAGGAKFILRSQSSIGNNYYSFENSSSVETHFVGLGSSGSDHFSFYTSANNDWSFYSNGSQVFKINNTAVTSFRNIEIPDATTNNQAVNLGQVNGLNASKVNNLDVATGIGFSGNFDNNPFFYNSSTGNYIILATRYWTESNFALINGSNTTGGSWKIDYILSDILTNSVGNGQVFNVNAAGQIYWGNPNLNQHIFEISNSTGLQIFIPGSGYGQFWHEFNFDPSTKVNKSGDIMTGALEVVQMTFGSTPNKLRLTRQSAEEFGVIGESNIWANIYVANATAPNHAVAFGQLGNYALLSQVYTQSQALALFVGKNGVETIYDTKTFDSSPIVPNATLAGHTVNLGQLLGFGYQNASQVTAIVNSAVSGIPAPGNGSVVIQGINALTGTATFSMNQANNVVGSFDLTPQTKAAIQEGVEANSIIPSILEKSPDITYITNNTPVPIPITNKKTIINIAPGLVGANMAVVHLGDGLYDGYELAVNGCGEWVANLKGNIIDQCQHGNDITLVGNNALFWWSDSIGMWIQAI